MPYAHICISTAIHVDRNCTESFTKGRRKLYRHKCTYRHTLYYIKIHVQTHSASAGRYVCRCVQIFIHAILQQVDMYVQIFSELVRKDASIQTVHPQEMHVNTSNASIDGDACNVQCTMRNRRMHPLHQMYEIHSVLVELD